MRYDSFTGLDMVLIMKLADLVEPFLLRQGKRGRPCLVPVSTQVEITLLILRQNISQSAVADLYHLGQSTICRIFNRIVQIVKQVTSCHGFSSFEEAIRDRVVLVDGTDIPTGNKAGHRNNYCGKRHRHGVSVQVAGTLDGQLLSVSFHQYLARITTEEPSQKSDGKNSYLQGNGSQTKDTSEQQACNQSRNTRNDH